MSSSETPTESSPKRPDSSRNSLKNSSLDGSSLSSRHAVYLVKTQVGLRDPDIPGPRSHHIILVETNPDNKSGVKFIVVGDITSGSGMTYESREDGAPERTLEAQSKNLLGHTAADGSRARWDHFRESPNASKAKGIQYGHE